MLMTTKKRARKRDRENETVAGRLLFFAPEGEPHELRGMSSLDCSLEQFISSKLEFGSLDNSLDVHNTNCGVPQLEIGENKQTISLPGG